MGELRFSHIEEFQIADDSPRFAIDAQSIEFTAVRRRAGEPYLIAIDHRRRPAAIVNRRFPDDIIPLAPIEGEIACIRVAISIGPAELRPLVRGEHDQTMEKQKKSRND